MSLSQQIPNFDPGRGVHRAPDTATDLKAPFPWPGGKSKVADMVWERLGNVDNYVEPFAGSLAVLLRRPADHFASRYRVETCNDADHFLVNLWRAAAVVKRVNAGRKADRLSAVEERGRGM